MRSFTLLSTIIALTFALAGCGGGGGGAGTTGGSTGHGATLRFVDSGASATRSAATRSVGSADFEEGNLLSTRTYLFILKNTGTTAAHDITLASDNPAVHMTPSTIGILQPEGSGGVEQVIQVSVEHGVSAVGAGFAPTLPAGRLVFNISATSAEVSASATVGLTVQLAKFTVVYDSVAQDLSAPLITADFVTPGGAKPLNFYDQFYTTPPSTEGIAVIHNTGNVDLTVITYTLSGVGALYTPSATQAIAPGATFAYDGDVDSGAAVIHIKIDSGGTEFDSNLPHAAPDGAWWALFSSEPSPAG